jgi:hypothetical protein
MIGAMQQLNHNDGQVNIPMMDVKVLKGPMIWSPPYDLKSLIRIRSMCPRDMERFVKFDTQVTVTTRRKVSVGGKPINSTPGLTPAARCHTSQEIQKKI